ncbi:MAG TPA: DNA damage-inducible protein D [Ktedonobacterales bacterium]|jgi:DNA-damage-inducible protein D
MATGERVSAFERIRQLTEEGGEYWSARDLSRVLGYSGWQRFRLVVEKAQTACENSGQQVSDHFNASVKLIRAGKGAQRKVEDFHLSRYACYLIVQNADPAKEIVALGQTYFAIQTRRQELADEAALVGMGEDQKRLYVRDQLRVHNAQLADAARAAGVMTPLEFAIFQDHGYRGLYAGMTAQDIAAHKQLRSNQPILDYMGSEELAANLFRATQAEAKIRREDIQGTSNANAAHHTVGAEVRATIKRLGGTMPEDLPTPPESIAQVQRHQKHLARQQAADSPAAQGALFADTEDAE